MARTLNSAQTNHSVRAADQGLAIERRFTTRGVHPVRRGRVGAPRRVIGDPAKPAFEQRGVEFPKTWSQNATNIVAQKYFRGQLGTPAREHSVKQMVGRVAGTIAAWGREGGYFASADAEAFEAELTPHPRQPDGGLQLAGLVQRRVRGEPAVLGVSAVRRAGLDARGHGPDRRARRGRADRARGLRRQRDDPGVRRQGNGSKPVFAGPLTNGSFVEATRDHVVKAVSERRYRAAVAARRRAAAGMRLHLYRTAQGCWSRAFVAAGAWRLRSLDGLRSSASATDDETAKSSAARPPSPDGYRPMASSASTSTGTNRSLTIEFQVANDESIEWVTEQPRRRAPRRPP